MQHCLPVIESQIIPLYGTTFLLHYIHNNTLPLIQQQPSKILVNKDWCYGLVSITTYCTILRKEKPQSLQPTFHFGGKDSKSAFTSLSKEGWGLTLIAVIFYGEGAEVINMAPLNIWLFSQPQSFFTVFLWKSFSQVHNIYCHIKKNISISI